MMISSASVRHRGAESVRSASALAHLDEFTADRGKKEVSKKRVRGVKEGRRMKADAAVLNDESDGETSGWSKPSSSPSSSTTSASPSRMGSQSSDGPPDMHMGRGEVLRLAILHSITQGNFVDTEFHLFSRRRQHADGIEVFGPCVAYANSAILKRASPELNSLLARVDDEESQSQSRPCCLPAEEYLYEDDSDLEDDDQDEEMSAGHALRGDKHTADAYEEENGMHGIADARVGRVAVMHDVAFKTWTALVSYLYTNEVSFAPLRSLSARTSKGRTSAMHEGCKPHKTVSCSPKSMYRLAEKYGLVELKQLALNNIRAQLCVQNILVELFSDFTSRYLEVHQLEVDFFCKQCVRPDVMAALPRFLDNMSGGCLPQCSEVLLSIILSLTAKGQGVASK